MRTPDLEARLWVAALLCLAATLAIGAVVAHRTPGRFDTAVASALHGEAIPVALFFTGLGRWPVLIGLGVLAFGIAMSVRAGVAAVTIVCATQVLAQAVNALLKLGFGRARPDAWLQIHETDLSFPSGHAATAVVFFAGFALLAWHAPFPRPLAAVACAALLVCALGIPWSRVALGAHYATDVLGGLFLGAAFLCAALAVITRFAPASAPG